MGRRCRTILVVDDDEDIHAVIAVRLQACGYACVSSYTVEDSIAKIASGGIDLVLLDLCFEGPGASGSDLLQILKGAKRSGLPIIVTSGCVEKEIIDYVLDLGADGFVAKPYDPRSLVGMVDERLHCAAP